MTTRTEPDVLVVGAGPTGLMAACELARRGVGVRLVDQAAAPFTGSRGKGLQPRTLEVLDALGVTGRLVTLGRFRLPLRFYDEHGGFQEIDLSGGAEPTPSSPYARTLIIAQWRVEQTLREHLSRLGVEVEWGKAVTGLTQGEGQVRVELADGTHVPARYVIGCDGGSSTVRRLLGVAFLGETNEEERMLLGDIRLDGLDRDHWHIWSRPSGGSLALCPLPSVDAFQLQASFSPGDPTEPSLSAFQAIIDAVMGSGTVHVRDATWLSRWRLNVRMVERYRVGRVFLAGDAAHVHSPAGGQGMNTGIQDAANLGWKLAAVLGGAAPALLDTYEAERRPVAAEMLGLTQRLMGQAPGTHGEDEQAMRQMGVTYRGGPLAPAGPGPDPQPGDRAPDAVCQWPDGRRVRLFDLQRGGHWTLYGFGRRPAPLEGPVRGVGIGTDVLDPEGLARRTYSATDGELILIRPDGHVGLRGHEEAALTAYLQQWGGKRGKGDEHRVLRP